MPIKQVLNRTISNSVNKRQQTWHGKHIQILSENLGVARQQLMGSETHYFDCDSPEVIAGSSLERETASSKVPVLTAPNVL